MGEMKEYWNFKDVCTKCTCEWTLSIPPFDYMPRDLKSWHLPCPECGEESQAKDDSNG